MEELVELTVILLISCVTLGNSLNYSDSKFLFPQIGLQQPDYTIVWV